MADVLKTEVFHAVEPARILALVKAGLCHGRQHVHPRHAHLPNEDLHHPSFDSVDVTGLDPMPDQGWLWDGKAWKAPA